MKIRKLGQQRELAEEFNLILTRQVQQLLFVSHGCGRMDSQLLPFVVLSFDWTGAGGHCYLLLLVAYLLVVISPISFVDFNQEYNGAVESPPLNNIF